MKKKISIILCLVILISVLTMPVNAAPTIVGAARVNTDSSSLNVRGTPSTNGTIKARLSKNTYVTLINKQNNFWYVQYGDNLFGYCYESYLKQVSGTVRIVKTTSGRLRVRANPTVTANIIDYISSGEQVAVTLVENSFARIIYNGNKVGYVHSNYVVKPESFTPKFKAISLNVPDYKQTDSRWANVKLGNSGQTIGKIGCATTALAMVQSYKEGTNIYPHIMAKRLSYTSGGAVYWPKEYSIITSQSKYLSVIYNALKNNKPVIVGAKNTYGGQHYIVVTGVKATNTLTTADFYINDPGSNTRTTLNQFFNAYPDFYKMLYMI